MPSRRLSCQMRFYGQLTFRVILPLFFVFCFLLYDINYLQYIFKILESDGALIMFCITLFCMVIHTFVFEFEDDDDPRSVTEYWFFIVAVIGLIATVILLTVQKMETINSFVSGKTTDHYANIIMVISFAVLAVFLSIAILCKKVFWRNL